jgi:malonate-semialdehyde dehydrogenase (acetylating)/methylmalonate-semialdehyde dehydrogenase
MVNGGKPVVDMILNDSDIRAVSFVGSSKVGDYIFKEGTKNDKRV